MDDDQLFDSGVLVTSEAMLQHVKNKISEIGEINSINSKLDRLLGSLSLNLRSNAVPELQQSKTTIKRTPDGRLSTISSLSSSSTI